MCGSSALFNRIRQPMDFSTEIRNPAKIWHVQKCSQRHNSDQSFDRLRTADDRENAKILSYPVTVFTKAPANNLFDVGGPHRAIIQPIEKLKIDSIRPKWKNVQDFKTYRN